MGILSSVDNVGGNCNLQLNSKEMKYKFETEDQMEGLRMLMATDMSIALFEIKNNMWRRWKDKDKISIAEMQSAIHEIMEDNLINLDDLIE
jgi:hypothetical protein